MLVWLVYMKVHTALPEVCGKTDSQLGSGRASVVTPRIQATIELQLEDDDERMATQLEMLFSSQDNHLSLND